MIVAVAFIPDTPLLVPEAAVREQPELTEMRGATSDVVSQVLAQDVDSLLLLGGGPSARAHGSSDWGDLRPYGVEVRVGLGGVSCAGSSSLSPQLTIAALALREATAHRSRPVRCEVRAFAVPDHAVDADIATWAEETAELPGRTGLVVAGSGAAGHGPRAPAGDLPGSEEFDVAVAHALAQCDVATLADLDDVAGATLGASGGRVWRLTGRAVRYQDGATAPSHPVRDGRLAWYGHPFGVGYVVGSWQLA